MSKPRREPVRLSTDDVPALDLARKCWAAGRRDQAVEQFDEAVRRHPANLRVLVDAARAHGFYYNYPRAKLLTERLIGLAPRRADVQHWAGETYRMIALADEAMACFERACEIQPTPAAQLELAALYERRHRLGEAAALIAEVRAILPGNVPAGLVAARIQRRSGDATAAEVTLRDLTAWLDAHSAPAAEAWGELAALYDEQQRWNDAWAAIAKCKELQLAHDAAELRAAEQVQARFRHMVDTITVDDLRRWREPAHAPSEPRRLALLTGFPRSGTTLIEQALDSHPQLVSSEERDVFSREVFPALGEGAPADLSVQEMLHRAPVERVAALRARYLRFMEGMLSAPIGDRVHLDKNPAMNLMIPAMLRVLPELRLLVALRDPRDVVLSCYMRHLPLNPVSVSFLTLKRTAERYLLDMRAWLRLREMLSDSRVNVPWIEIRYEATVADLEREARRALELLGLPWDDAVLTYRDRAIRRQVLSPTYDAVTKPIYTSSIGRWRNYARYLEPILSALQPMVRELGYDGAA